MTGRLISLIGLTIAAGAVLVAPSGGHALSGLKPCSKRREAIRPSVVT
jgi:hypothetical protein